ncbi:methyltransferase family protein [Pseudoduganella sp. UC29_106]|uniref:methyltransferase family protein n=1 Tax=Pseudoduganella sp. UC29_106 TaxID=3374553 RepID=UPI0037564D89
MFQVSSLFRSRLANFIGGLALAALWGLFALSHIDSWRVFDDWTYLIFCAAETLAAFLFLMRSNPVAVSSNPWDWLAGVVGTFSPLLFEPAEWGLLSEARHLMVLGCVMQIAGLLSLNRSFGLVPARRIIKTAGLYRIVRHPLYSSYLLGGIGYALSNSSWRNLAVACAVILLMLLRLVREERVLRQDAAYRTYMEQVPYRLIPLVY